MAQGRTCEADLFSERQCAINFLPCDTLVEQILPACRTFRDYSHPAVFGYSLCSVFEERRPVIERRRLPAVEMSRTDTLRDPFLINVKAYDLDPGLACVVPLKKEEDGMTQ